MLPCSGGVATYVNNKFHSEEIPIDTVFEAILIEAYIPRKIHIANIYLPNSQALTYDDFLHFINQIPKPFIICGDFNSHNPLWGSDTLDSRGKIIEKILLLNDLTLLNTKESTHYNLSSNSYSAIDLSLCSPDITHLLDWQVLDTAWDSDHIPCKIHIENPNFSQRTNCNDATHSKWNLTKVDWQLFREVINNKVTNINQQDDDMDINTHLNTIVQIIYESVDIAAPKISSKPGHRKVPWWNEDCNSAKKKFHHAFNILKKHPTTENKINYKKLRAIHRRTMKLNRRDHWIDYLSTINYKTDPKMAWSKIRRINGCRKCSEITSLITPDTRLVTDPLDIANCLVSKFATNSSDNNYTPEFRKLKSNSKELSLSDIPPPVDSPMEDPFELQELIATLKSVKNSSPGPDGISNLLIKNLPLLGTIALLNLFNRIWTQRTFPSAWRTAIVVPILKPNKNKLDCASYRPIALTNNLCKILERMVNCRLVWNIESRNLLCNIQYGFRKLRSTIDHLTILQSLICKAFNNNEHLTIISLDIEKAYEMVWRTRIFNTLRKWEVGNNTIAFILNLLTDRYIQVRVQQTLSNPELIQNGLPQGSVISVTLFLIAINDISANLVSPVKGCLFADDFTILCSGKNTDSTQKLLQQSLNKLSTWGSRTGFIFSKTKSQHITFWRGRKTFPPLNLALDLSSIKEVEYLRILGYTFDKRLTWAQHLKNLKTNCSTRINILKSIACKSWGTERCVLLTTYKALVRSKIDYGSVIYDSACPKLLNILNPIQDLCARIILNAFCTTPVSSILSELYEPPLNIRRKKSCLLYALSVATTPQNPATNYMKIDNTPTIPNNR